MRAHAFSRVALGLTAAVVAAALAVVATAGLEATPAAPYKAAGKWGGKSGTGNGQFKANAYGLAVDKSGNVYVADTDNFRIQVFSATGAFRRAIPFASGESVQDVAVDPSGDVWGTALQAGEARRFGGSAATIATPKSALGVGVDAAGNVYVATGGDNVTSVIRFDNASGTYTQGKTFGGLQAVGDVEASPDGTWYAVDSRALTVKRFDANGKLLKTIKGGVSNPIGIGVDLDCNLWFTNISQRNITKVTPTGKVLATLTAGSLIAQDVAVGPKGDVYAYDSGSWSVVRFTEDRSKPATAVVGGNVAVTNGVAKVRYTLSGVACPAQVAATASLRGAVSGKAAVRVPVGKPTVLSIPVKGGSGKATFTIVLKTNGRPTTQVASVNVGAR